jgi:hypothetical protein
MTKQLLLAVLVAILPCGAAAQATPQAAADRYITEMKSGDWRRTAAMMHPAALAELKSLFAMVAAADSAGGMLYPLFRVSSATEFDALSSSEVFARLMASVTSGNPGLGRAMREMRAEIVGAVPEGQDTAHVVYRMHTTVDGFETSKLDVLSFARAGDRWLALLTGDVQALAQTLTRALEPRD